MSDAPRRPSLRAAVRVAPSVSLVLERGGAFDALAAVHDARVALQRMGSPVPQKTLDALCAHERELGVALGVDEARAFLRARRG